MVVTTRHHTPQTKKLIEKAADLLHSDEMRQLQNAVVMAEFAYGEQEYETGERLLDRAEAVTQILLEYNLDLETIIAALLHNVITYGNISPERIEESFGEGVACLVEGLVKLSDIPEKASEERRKGKAATERRHAENLRNLILATASDVRVMLLRLAEQLHTMNVIHLYSPEQQESAARETLEIYAPIAERMGMSRMKAQLEDCAFEILEPQAFDDIVANLRAHREEHAERLEAIRKQLLSALQRSGIKVGPESITTRQKHIYGIHRKMQTEKYYGKGVWRIYDRLGIRVVVPTVTECYQALGVVHSLWKAVPDEFDDYISNPRPTGYRSLHTAVQYTPDDSRDIVEVQIRTPEMHEQAEYGIAAHWRYKEDNWKSPEVGERIKWLRQLLELGHEISDPQDFVDAMKTDVFADRVYVFSPEGDIFDLPAGATPIDFAYYVHTEIGHRCRGAKVNGKLVGLEKALQTGDRVEIVTAKRGGPSRDWINLDYVKTRRAQSKIRQWFRRQDREKMVAQGRESVDRVLKRLSITTMSHEAIKDFFEYKTVEDFLAAVGFGDINDEQIATRLLEAERRQQPDDMLEPAITRPFQPQPAEGINIMGTEGLLVHLAPCCNPVPGDPIIGYITRGRGATIHRTDCANIRNTPDQERLINVSWGAPDEQHYQVPVMVKAYNHGGLLRDIGGVVADLRLSISNMNAATDNNVTTLHFTIDISDTAQLGRVFHKFLQLPNVIDVRRRTH